MQYFIESNRVGFGVWKKENIKEAELLWGNSEVTKYITASGKMSKKDISNRLSKEIEMYSKYSIQYFPIYLKNTGKFIGCCGLRPYNINENILEVGIHLIPDYWRQGYAYEACMRIIRYAFDDLSCSAIFAGHNPKNTASSGLLKKLGFIYSHDEYYEPTGLNHPSYFLKKI